MTVESALNDGITHDGGGVATNFSFPFKVNNSTQIEIIITDAAGDESIITTNFTVNNPNVEGSGSVDYPTVGSPLAIGSKITINPKMDYKQATDIVNQGRNNPAVIEAALDTLMMHIKEVRGLLNRTLKFKKSLGITEQLFIEAPVDQAALIWNGVTGAVANGPSVGSISDAASNAANAAISAAEAVVSADLIEDWAVKVDGIVESTDYSSKAYALGGTGITDTATKGSAKDWATKAEDATVDTVEFSAKHYAAKAAASAAILLNVKSYGAAGNNIANDTSSIQAAEDYATSLGVPVILNFPPGTYAISDSIVKKANVHWRGVGKLRRRDNAAPTGDAFALVTASSVDNWSIEGVQFENVDWATDLSVPLTRSVTLGNYSSCIDILDCDHFYIKDINCRKFSQAIIYRGCKYFTIAYNNCVAESGKTVEQIIAGTYTPHSSYQNTLGIGSLYDAGGLSNPSQYFTIKDNYVEIPGLDVGIFVLSQTYDKFPSIVTGNIVRGANAAIQIYRGSFTDPGSAPTYNTGVIVSNNSSYATVEQGIYFRGSVGCQISNNYIERAGQGGENGATSANSISLRVNPFEVGAASTFVSADDDDVSNDHGILVYGNRIVSHGLQGADCDPAILCEMDNVQIINNDITRPAEEFSTARCTAILAGNGKDIHNVVIRHNKVQGNWFIGVSLTNDPFNALYTDYYNITDNTFKGAFSLSGVSSDVRSFNVNISNNNFAGSYGDQAIKLRHSVFNRVKDNVIDGATRGLRVFNGTDLGAQANYLTANTVSKSIRRGSSNIVTGNIVTNTPTPFTVTETNGNDSSFEGRCAVFKENFVAGTKLVSERSGGTPATTFTTQTHIKHDFIPNSSISETAYAGKHCLTSGQYGNSTTATGDTTNTSPDVTNVSSLDGLGVGIFISLTGFSGTRKIIGIDPGNDTITLDANAGSDNTGATITAVTPTFVNAALSQLSANTSKNPTSLADGAGETLSFTVTGAALGDFVMVAAPYDALDLTITGYVQATNTVEVRLQNETGGVVDLGTGNWKVKVIK